MMTSRPFQDSQTVEQVAFLRSVFDLSRHLQGCLEVLVLARRIPVHQPHETGHVLGGLDLTLAVVESSVNLP